MKILSLFDGISCARVALERAGIRIEKYYASEVDKHAIKIALKNYQDTIQLGSVTDITADMVGNIDIMCGGSPCQDLSIACQGREGLNGKRSSLFWEYVRLLKEIQPEFFVLENVNSMSQSARHEISITIGFTPIMLDASFFSAQSRKRLFWVGKKHRGGYARVAIPRPVDMGIVLKEILEKEGVAYLVGNQGKTIVKRIDKSLPLLARDGKGFNTYGSTGIVDVDPISCSFRGRCVGGGTKTTQQLEFGGDKAFTITSFAKDSMVFTKPIRVASYGKGRQVERIYSIHGKSVCLTANGGGGGTKTGIYALKDYLRILTPIECERLQGLPDNFSEGIAKTHRYKCLGNAFNVDVVAHIFKEIKRLEGAKSCL